jgi:hypothetical protein
MFITENINPGEMLAELLKWRRVRAVATVRFANWKHDKHLCPKLADRLNAMLTVYRAYGHEVHDVQGFHDNGIDVLMKYEDKNGNERKAGIQIKSEDEFRRWERDKLDIVKTLKAQHATAIHDAGVDDFYLVLCVDAVRHRTRLRTLNAALMNFKPCTIIDPEDALSLFEADGLDITIWATRQLCQRDTILRAAIDDLENEYPDVAFFQIDLACRAFDGERRVCDEDLFEIWNDWAEFAGEQAGDPERLSEVLSSLTGSNLLQDDGGGIDYLIAVNLLPTSLCALYFDQKVRSLARAAEMRDHLVRLTDLSSRLGPEDNDEAEDDEET